MSFMKGSASFVRFSVEGELPENPLDYIAHRVRSYAFEDIDDTIDEFSIGWVAINNMFDNQFSYSSYFAGDYVVLGLRLDERKVSPALLKKFVAKEEERVRVEKELPKLPRSLKVQIKERVRSELVRKSLPVPAVYEVVWSLSDSVLYYFTTNKKAHTLLEDHFHETFGLLLRQQIPYTVAEYLVTEENAAVLDKITPDFFV